MGETDSICATASYLLTHHAYKKGTTGYTYFGHFSYNRAKVIKTIVEEMPVKCPKCQAHLERWDKFDIRDDQIIDFSCAECIGPAYETKKINFYKLTWNG